MTCQPQKIGLALQGGGSHGAFAWGVLDTLMASGRFEIDGISGSSAGAVNGVLLAQGLARGGADAAREEMARFWRKLGDAAALSPFQPTWLEQMTGTAHLEASPMYQWFDLMMRVMSPYQFNPTGWNALESLLKPLLDEALVNSDKAPPLYVSATDVHEGRLTLFTRGSITAKVVAASACLPFLFQAVEIDGKHYWDGGYMGNPTLYPLINDCGTRDIVIVQINPQTTPDLPTHPTQIIDRMNEISFNATLMREIRGIEVINRLMADGDLAESCGKSPIRLHRIGEEDALAPYSTASKFAADRAFLNELFELGQQSADRWLRQHADQVGTCSTCDLERDFAVEMR
ncbi:MAG: patatin-like phospholipase family protein [Alphaproteobacteria bacterium]